ncbi:Glycosyltransferase Gtf1 [bioreactor metagenome]|uniref:Glycosyltransferase Gtf1 n=1 Tax=bioreactor metagenome TaxID=1076179 RepID=A0A645B0R2_9ZZZZ
MRIFIVCRGYPTSKYVMNGIFEFDQAKALAARGHEVIYLAIDLRSIRRWRHWGRESLKKDSVNIEAINIPLGRVPQKILHSFGKSGLSSVFKQCVKKYGKPDIIHAHFTDSAYFAVKALKKYDFPIIMTEHNSGITEKVIYPHLKTIASFTYPLCDKIIVVSPSLKQTLDETFDQKSDYIPNIVDVGAFRFAKHSLDLNEIFTFVSIGGLIPRKGMDILIRQFSKFHSEAPKSKLIIFGEGSEQKSLEQLIEEFKISEHVKLMGLRTRHEIASVLSSSDVFVLASKNETFGVAYIEALACGVPVIATTCGGPEGFVHEGNGILIPVDDEKALLEAMNTMYDKASTYDRVKIAAEISEKFSPDSVAEQLEDVYRFELRNIQ